MPFRVRRVQQSNPMARPSMRVSGQNFTTQHNSMPNSVIAKMDWVIQIWPKLKAKFSFEVEQYSSNWNMKTQTHITISFQTIFISSKSHDTTSNIHTSCGSRQENKKDWMNSRFTQHVLYICLFMLYLMNIVFSICIWVSKE